MILFIEVPIMLAAEFRLSRLLVCIVLLCTSILTVSFSCTNFDSNMGATYDLTDLYRTPDQPPYIVTDGDIPCTDKVEQNYTYMFNVCGTVSHLPKTCSTYTAASAAAVQINQLGTVDESDDWCYLAGKYEDTTTTLALLNQEDPTEGVKLTYYGTPCSSGIKRKFILNLSCANRLSAVPTHAMELAGCEYTITMPSIYGCPLECGVANRRLCGGNGHCMYDNDQSSAKCFCNHGYTGSACTETVYHGTTINYSPALLGLIITLFIIVIALAGSIVYMTRQMTAYKEDLANYQVLKGSEEDSAVV